MWEQSSSDIIGGAMYLIQTINQRNAVIFAGGSLEIGYRPAPLRDTGCLQSSEHIQQRSDMMLPKNGRHFIFIGTETMLGVQIL